MSAADPHSGGSAASGAIGAGPVWALAVDPDTSITLYAGTVCSGVLESVDGPESWSAVNTGLRRSYVDALAIDPTTPTTLYAGTYNGGVFRSLNGGSSWQATGLVGDAICNDGVPSGVDVDVALIIQAAGSALSRCGA